MCKLAVVLKYVIVWNALSNRNAFGDGKDISKVLIRQVSYFLSMV